MTRRVSGHRQVVKATKLRIKTMKSMSFIFDPTDPNWKKMYGYPVSCKIAARPPQPIQLAWQRVTRSLLRKIPMKWVLIEKITLQISLIASPARRSGRCDTIVNARRIEICSSAFVEIKKNSSLKVGVVRPQTRFFQLPRVFETRPESFREF
jgi:hypothetical protein